MIRHSLLKNIVTLQHGENHYKKQHLLGMQDVHPFLYFSGFKLYPHQESAHRQPTHDHEGQYQPVVGPQGNVAVNTSHHKGRGVGPYMKNKQTVKRFLDLFQVVTQADPLGREIDVGGEKKNHAQVPGPRGQVVIRHIGVYDSQHREAYEHGGSFPEREATE